MHVTRLGGGPCSLILHGFAGSAEEMLDLADRLPGRKLVPDLPGHGRSAKAPATDHSMQAVVSALVVLLDGEEVDKVDVVGYSMGGRVALGLAALRPTRVRSAVAIGGRTGIEDATERSARLESDLALADQIERRGAEWFAEEWLGRPLYDTQRRLGEAHMAAVRRQRASIDPHGVADSLRHLGPAAQPEVGEALARSGVPTLLVVGELDHRFREIADAIAARDPDAHLAVIPDAGHATHVESPRETAAAIAKHWATVR